MVGMGEGVGEAVRVRVIVAVWACVGVDVMAAELGRAGMQAAVDASIAIENEHTMIALKTCRLFFIRQSLPNCRYTETGLLQNLIAEHKLGRHQD